MRFTQLASAYMLSQGISTHDIIAVISGYEVIDEDVESGLIRVSKTIAGRRLLVIYTAAEDSLVVVYVNVREVSR